MDPAPKRIFTVGHSTHPPERFLRLLRRHGIRVLADVRRFPGSRRLPHFNAGEIASILKKEGIEYAHLPELGGRRRPRPDSPNDGWREGQFRGYADHMTSCEFRRGIERLASLAAAQRTAAMCAEAPWWRCHRRLLSDALLALGFEVFHIGPRGELARHAPTPFAVIEEEQVLYPSEQARLGL